MPRRDRIRDKYPIFSAYGGKHEFLTTEAAIAATTEERIRSIWPFIVRRIIDFQETLKPRERANFDHEDTLTEVWIALAEKDAEWRPERGKYITYAGVIIERELCAIRDRARTVHSPRNSSCRLKEYQAEEDSGGISPRRKKTADDIRRTAESIQELAFAADQPAPDASLDEDEGGQPEHPEIVLAIRSLHPFEANVIGRSAGLWGREPQSDQMIAFETASDVFEVRRAKSRALRKIKATISASANRVA